MALRFHFINKNISIYLKFECNPLKIQLQKKIENPDIFFEDEIGVTEFFKMHQLQKNDSAHFQSCYTNSYKLRSKLYCSKVYEFIFLNFEWN
jgi:hypothetical protein